MEVKERILKESGSCPQIGRQNQHRNSPRVEIASSINRSSTFLSQQDNNNSSLFEDRSMKRLNRSTNTRVSNNPLQRSQKQQPRPGDLIIRGKPLIQNLCRPCGDALDYDNPICYIPTLRDNNTRTENSRSCPSLEIDKRHIDVIVRIRPKNRSEEMSKTMVWKTSENALIFDPKEKNSDFFYKGKRQVLRNDFGKKRPNKNLAFGFDYVYGQDSTNEEIFEISLKGLISKVLGGFNCTVFAYGATGSGKTYTMLGSADQSCPGLSVLMAEELYRRLQDMKSEVFTHDIKVSYLEVYNETIKDLFNPDKELTIREDGKQGLRIPQLTVHKPDGPKELLRLLRSGNGNRSQHATDYNAESSRSHAVFEITILMHQHSPTERFKQRTATSRLFMVDLAGSEKGSVNIVDGMRLREGANINKSLLALSNCINALADGKQHIPYRNSKLTRLLKDSLSGNCVTVMIANISPADNSYEDTHNTLHYASRAKNIKVACKQNAFSEELVEETECNNRISDLQNEVRMLAQELADERRKHQATRELLECQLGDGDGFGGGGRRIVAAELSPQEKPRHNKQVFKSAGGEIHHHHEHQHPDPVALNRLVDLFKQKTELVANLTDSCIHSRLVEWEMTWKKLQVDIAEMIGRPKTSDTQHFISITKLRNSQSDLEMTTHPCLTVEGKELESSLKNINYEIENVHKTCLQSLCRHQNEDDDDDEEQDEEEDLTLSFEEFIRHRSMDMELETMEKLVKFHQKLENCVFGELKNSQIHRFHLLQFIQRIVINLKEYQQQSKDFARAGVLWTKEMEKKFHALLKPVYDSSVVLEPPAPQKRIDLREDFAKLENVFTSPVITFSPLLASSSSSIVQQTSSELLPTTANPSSLLQSTTIFRINDTSAKDTCLSNSDSEITTLLKSHHTNKQAGNRSKFPSEPESRHAKVSQGVIRRPGILPQVKEEEGIDENTILESPPTDSPPTSANETEAEDLFLNQESSSAEEQVEKLVNNKSYKQHEKPKCFETLTSKRDNQPHHVHKNNMSPTNALGGGGGGDDDAVIKQRGKDTRTKSYTSIALHRGQATTDFVHGENEEEEGSKSGNKGQRKPTNNAVHCSLPVHGGGSQSRDKGGNIKGQDTGIVTLSSTKQQTLLKNPRRIPVPVSKKSKIVRPTPDPIPTPPPRPFTFCYEEENTSQSSFDNSFD